MATCWHASLGKTRPNLGIVVGLEAEARLARPLGLVAVGGGLPQGALLAAKSLISQGVTALLSFGLAGALDPALRPGELVIPRFVRMGELCFPCTPILASNTGGMLAAERILASAGEKSAAWQATGAVAVDLESGAVAQAAGEAGLGFAVLRAICDPAERSLPPAAIIALDHAGRIGLLRVLASVARQPWQVPVLLHLAGDARAARRALAAAVAAPPFCHA